MNITRVYKPKTVNWNLLPDLVEKVQASISAPRKQETSGLKRFLVGSEPSQALMTSLEAVLRYQVTTFSQSVSLDAGDEFLAFLKMTTEESREVDIVLDCCSRWGDSDLTSSPPPYFHFSWRPDRLFVSLGRNATANALRLIEELERVLLLEPAAGGAMEKPKRPPMNRTVFLAHSFDDTGRSYAFQLTKFFSLIGFEVATGEGYSPESVSNKVRRRLLAQEITVAIVSEKDDMTWLIQETTAAGSSRKPLVLLVEEGVSLKQGILGDLEYIRFPPGHISATFAPILEGLRELGFSFIGPTVEAPA